MEPEIRPPFPEAPPADNNAGQHAPTEDTTQGLLFSEVLLPEPAGQPGGVRWVFLGNHGLRAGWSVTVFLLLTILFMVPLNFLASLLAARALHLPKGNFTPQVAILQEAVALISLLLSGAIVAFIERRRLLDFNLTGPHRMRRFIEGLIAGFVALSALVGALISGGWLHFGPTGLSAAQIVSYAVLWGVCFLFVGCFEEGAFRCYLQFTLTRGINFWWALAVEAGICIDLALRDKGNGVWGVYAVVLLGLVPCLLLELRKSEGSGFWQAAWVTSTVFGFIHTSNNGENWIGIFAAAVIGFVFCVSIWVTGSAWWAIGCHAGWDWAETYFYGTADSGMQAQGHYFTSTPAGNVLWSGGTDGPEGSLLVLGVILLLLVALLVIYGRKRELATAPAAIASQSA